MYTLSTSFDVCGGIKYGVSQKLIRIARLKEFAVKRDLVGPTALGSAIGKKPNQVRDLLAGDASFGEKIARSIEEFAGLPSGWLDGEDTAVAATPTVPPPIPFPSTSLRATPRQLLGYINECAAQLTEAERKLLGAGLESMVTQPGSSDRIVETLVTLLGEIDVPVGNSNQMGLR